MQKSQTELQNEAANLERSGKKVGENLRRELTDIQNRIEERRKVNEQYSREQGEVRVVFTEDIARYRKLKGIKNN